MFNSAISVLVKGFANHASIVGFRSFSVAPVIAEIATETSLLPIGNAIVGRTPLKYVVSSLDKPVHWTGRKENKYISLCIVFVSWAFNTCERTHKQHHEFMLLFLLLLL